MTRDFAITVLLVAVVLLLIIAMYQRAPQPDLPLVQAAAGPGRMLFAPCPVVPRTPPRKERTA